MTRLVERILAAIPAALPQDRRWIVAIAGPPAAGKSTLAEQLRDVLEPRAVVLGLDAFHLDNAILDERGHRARKGAPHTFDVDGYRRALQLLQSEPHASIAIPEFDRSLDVSRNAAAMVLPQHRIVITEGNYLLLEDQPWSALRSLFDLTVRIEVPHDVIEARIRERWLAHGFDADEVHRRLVENDLPNARLVIEGSRDPDLTIVTGVTP